MFGQKPNMTDEKVHYCCSDPLRESESKNTVKHKTFTDTPQLIWAD